MGAMKKEYGAKKAKKVFYASRNKGKIKGVEKIKSQYGASAESSLVEREILEEGETFRYTFSDKDGNEKTHDSSSMPLFIGMQNAEFNIGDTLHIRREGKGDKTRYFVEKTEDESYPEETDPKNMPF